VQRLACTNHTTNTSTTNTTHTSHKHTHTGEDMGRHQEELMAVHRQQAEMEARVREACAAGSVPRPVAAQLQQQLDKSSAELQQAERQFRVLERQYFTARESDSVLLCVCVCVCV
jgi:hypothetical protein